VTTLVLLVIATNTFFGRPTVGVAGLLLFGTWAVATFGTAAGAHLLTRSPRHQWLDVIGAGAGGTMIYMACIYVTEHFTPWL
jgi:hypothetical protein